jgi:hypothetical protein
MTWKLAVLALAAATTVAAQENMAPQQTAEGKRFVEGFLGTWTATDVSLSAGGNTMTGTMKIQCEAVSSGWGTLCRSTTNLAGMPPSEATYLMAWDIATGEAHMFEVSDSAEVHDHSGKWIDGKSVSLVREGKARDGKEEKDDCTATWLSARELKFDCTGTQAGTKVWTFTATSKK